MPETPPANSEESVFCAGGHAYESKDSSYFAGARRDYVSELPASASAKILEVGCGRGGTGALALSEKKCGAYYGVELCRDAAEAAVQRLTEVVVGDVEQLDLPWEPETFDAVILSEVLEHLADPWATLKKLRVVLKSGGRVFASSPNVAHYRVVAMLLRGDWALTDFGLMDRTHLRWFTPTTYRRMFDSCGYRVDAVREHQPLSRKAQAVSALTFGQFRHLFIRQIDLRAHCG
ncbi:MAG: class I SAM-dependent methyltransferase [Terriglobia bacterium]